jgi:hypothetical protein
MRAVLITQGTRSELRPFADIVPAIAYFKQLAYAALYAAARPGQVSARDLVDVLEELESRGHRQWDLPADVAAALAQHQEFEVPGVWGAVLMRGAVFRWDVARRCDYVLGSGSSASAQTASKPLLPLPLPLSLPLPLPLSLPEPLPLPLPTYGAKRLRLEPVPTVQSPGIPDVTTTLPQVIPVPCTVPAYVFDSFKLRDKVVEADTEPEAPQVGEIIRVDDVKRQFVVRFPAPLGAVIRRAYELLPVA